MVAAGFVPMIMHIYRKVSSYSNGGGGLGGSGLLTQTCLSEKTSMDLRVRVDTHFGDNIKKPSSEKNCEAASCQGFLSFLYFLFPIALYWQQMDYSLIQFLDILSHMLSLFLFLSPSSPFQYFFSPSNSSGFPFSSHAFFHLNISFSL